MIPKPSPITYNIFAGFFLAWVVVAGYLLALGDSSPMDRLAFAVCGTLGVYAATMGKMFAWCGRIPRSFFGVPVWTRVFLILLALCVGGLWLVSRFINANYADHFTAMRMKEQFHVLMAYTGDNGDVLPPDISSKKVIRYLGLRQRIEQKQRSGDPFVWNEKLSGMNLQKFDGSDWGEVVVAYSQRISENKQRVVLTLDAKVNYHVSEGELQILLRKSDAVIAAAKRTKPNAAKPANAVH